MKHTSPIQRWRLLARFRARIETAEPYPPLGGSGCAHRATDAPDMHVAETDQPGVGAVGIAAAVEGLAQGHERYQSESSAWGQIAHYWRPVVARTTT